MISEIIEKGSGFELTPRVSVIMPVFGRTDFLCQSLDSVFQQTFSDFELILVDDNEPDSDFRKKTTELVNQQRSLGREIIYIQHDSNRNGAAARNTGLKKALGQYISFLDSDDIYLPTRLEAAVAAMDGAGPAIGGVYTGVEFRRGGEPYDAFGDAQPGNFLIETLACRFKLGTGSNLFIRKSVADELGGFDESFWRHQDYEFMVRFFCKYDLAAISSILVVKNNENFNLPKFSRSLEIKEQYLEKYRYLINKLSEPDRFYVMNKNYIWLGEMALREGKRLESKKMYSVANRYGGTPWYDSLRRLAFWLLSWSK